MRAINLDTSAFLDELSERVRLKGINSLSADEKVAYVISWADFEICLGGISGYLYNSAGDNLAELPRAYSVIGASAVSEMAKNVVVQLSATCNIGDRESRCEALQNPSDKLSQTMKLFEETITEHENDWEEKFCDFVASRWP